MAAIICPRCGGAVEVILGRDSLACPYCGSLVPAPDSPEGPSENALRRGRMALEDGEWATACACFDQVLGVDMDCAEAHLGKFMASVRVRRIGDLGRHWHPLSQEKRFQRAFDLASGELRETLEEQSARSDTSSKKYRENYRRYTEGFDRRRNRIAIEIAEKEDAIGASRRKAWRSALISSLCAFVLFLVLLIRDHIFPAFLLAALTMIPACYLSAVAGKEQRALSERIAALRQEYSRRQNEMPMGYEAYCQQNPLKF